MASRRNISNPCFSSRLGAICALPLGAMDPRGTKLQTPTPKAFGASAREAPSPKHQNLCPQPTGRIGAWDLRFSWDLGFGIWDFSGAWSLVFGSSPLLSTFRAFLSSPLNRNLDRNSNPSTPVRLRLRLRLRLRSRCQT